MIVCARYVREIECEEEGSDEDVRYFDAQITQVDRSPHTVEFGEEVCRCLFVVSWMAGPGKKLKNYDYLSCGDICLHNEADMEMHPAVRRIRRLLQGRVLGPQAKQHPARVSVRSNNSEHRLSMVGGEPSTGGSPPTGGLEVVESSQAEMVAEFFTGVREEVESSRLMVATFYTEFERRFNPLS
ncbi:hypothetical protein R1sor_010041 [Riccia sorocarpa]|uniref:SAWADEE domain-containing protein n=1 Tax=Riccia sorocarpa TaxID=122646 RepID=A0ABD3I0E7_9MARC